MRARSRRRLVVFAGCLIIAACGGKAYTTRVIETPETRHLKGYEKPYEVEGNRYEPLHTHEGFVEEGLASWYGDDFHGKTTSNGETYDMHALTAAHKILPMGVYVRVTSQMDGRSATVRINDRGPFVGDRIIDLSYAAARKLGVVGPGTMPVRIEALGFRDDASAGGSVYRQPGSYRVGSFTVQVGAFTQQNNASRLSHALRSQYGSTSIQKGWVKGRLFYRVRVGIYTTIESAEAARAGFEQDGYPGSFVVAVD